MELSTTQKEAIQRKKQQEDASLRKNYESMLAMTELMREQQAQGAQPSVPTAQPVDSTQYQPQAIPAARPVNSDDFANMEDYVAYVQSQNQNAQGNAHSKAIDTEIDRLTGLVGSDAVSKYRLSGFTENLDNAALNLIGGLVGGVAGGIKGFSNIGTEGYNLGAWWGDVTAGAQQGSDMASQMDFSLAGLGTTNMMPLKPHDEYSDTLTPEQKTQLERITTLQSLRSNAVAADEFYRKETEAAKTELEIRGEADFADLVSAGLAMNAKAGEYSYQKPGSTSVSDYQSMVMGANGDGDIFSYFGQLAGDEIAQYIDASQFEKNVPNPALYAMEHAQELLEQDTFGLTHKGGMVSAEYLYMTDEEVQNYSAILAKYGREKADEYFESIQHRLKERRAQHQYESQTKWAAEHPWAASGFSVLTGLGQGLAYVNTASTAVHNMFSDTDIAVDPYSPWNYFANTTSNLREGVSSTFTGDSAVGKWLQEQGMSQDQVVGLANFAYGTGMSMADCVASLVVFGPQFSSAAMALNAAGATANEAAKNGLSAGEGLALSTMAGAAEFFTEKLDIDRLMGLTQNGGRLLSREGIKNILISCGSEGTEELITSYANTLADIAIAGDRSQYKMYIKELMAQGMSEEEATKQANYQFFFLQPMQDFAGGAVSGGVFGTGGVAYHDASTTIYGSGLNANSVVAGANATGDAQILQMASELEGKIANGEKISSYDLGRLQLEVDYFNSLDSNGRLRRALEPKIQSGTATQAEQLAYKVANGEKVRDGLLRKVYADARATVELGQMLGVRLTTLDYTTMKAMLHAQAMRNKRGSTTNTQAAEQYQQGLRQLEQTRAQSQVMEQTRAENGTLGGNGSVNGQENTARPVQVLGIKHGAMAGVMGETPSVGRAKTDTIVVDSPIEGRYNTNSVDFTEHTQGEIRTFRNTTIQDVKHIELLRKKYNAGQKRNVAFAKCFINGEHIELEAISGAFTADNYFNKGNFLPPMPNNYHYIGPFPEFIHHTEQKIVEYLRYYLIDKYGNSSVIYGEIEIVSERAFCDNCRVIVDLFQREFSGVKVTRVEIIKDENGEENNYVHK